MLDKNGNEITFEEEVSKNRSALCDIKQYLLQKSLTSAMKESYMDPFTIQSYYINNVFDYIVNKYSAIDMLKYKMYPDFPECFNDDMAPLILPRFEERNGEKVLLVSGDGGKKFKENDEINEKYGLETTAIVTMAEVVEHLYNREYKGKVIIDDTLKASIDAYYEKYGVK